MELLTSPRTEYLLEASLVSLHAESREWLNAIAFWNQEMSFFYKLIHIREPHLDFPTEGIAEIERELIAITSDSLHQMKVSVEKHEEALRTMATNYSSGEETAYRDEHRKLVHAMYELQTQITKFKQRVYSYK